MSDLISSAANSFPNVFAFDDGTRKVTYRELKDLSLDTSWLVEARAGQGDHIVWCPRNDWQAFLTFWQLQSLGCVACPISSRFPEEKRNAVTEQLDAKWLPAGPNTRHERGSIATPDARFISPDTKPATIILSSGSTGIPKAIVHAMSAHIASAKGAATNMPLSPGDRWLWSLPLYHVSGLSILVRCALAGATVVGVPESTALSAQLLLERRITHLSVVNTQLRRLLANDSFPSPHLKSVLVGGSSVQPALIEEARLRGIATHTTYGLTEMASQVTTSTSTCPPTTSGRVLPGREVTVNEEGEILVRGETLCLGYYGAGHIRPVIDDAGWFHTRDRGRLNDTGQLTVDGRIDNMFVSGGENIYPETIERALLELSGVEQAIVVPKPDKEFGARPVAYVKGNLPADWATHLRASLRGFEVPTQVLAWPENSDLGIKPDRKKLERDALG